MMSKACWNDEAYIHGVSGTGNESHGPANALVADIASKLNCRRQDSVRSPEAVLKADHHPDATALPQSAQIPHSLSDSRHVLAAAHYRTVIYAI